MQSDTTIRSLLDENGGEVKSAKAIGQVIRRYFSKIYEASSSSSSTSAADAADAELFAIKLRSLSAAQTAALDADFTADEILAALDAIRVGDIPGPNGVPPSIWWDEKATFVPALVRLANALLDGKSLPKTEATFAVILELRCGNHNELPNYMYDSIQTSNVGRRVLGQALSNRMKSLSSFWPPPHHAYVRGHDATDTLGVLQMILTRLGSGKEISAPTALITLDQEKAIDRVDHDWLLRALAHYGFGPRMRSFVRGLLANAHVSFPLNQVEVKLKRGLLQSDPASPLLFLAAMLPLLDRLEHSGLGLTLGSSRPGPQLQVPYLACPDAITTFARLPEHFQPLQEQLKLYAAAVGDQVLKASVTILSSTATDYAALGEIKLACPLPIVTPMDEELPHLDHAINLRDGSVPRIAFAIQLSWLMRRTCFTKRDSMTLSTRIRVAEQELLPPLYSTMLFGPHPTDFVGQIMQELSRHIWQPWGQWLPVEVLTAPSQVGGLGLVDPDHKLIAHTGAAIVGWLKKQDEAGIFFRRSLHDYLRDQGLSESSLLLRHGEVFKRRINNRLKARDSFWGSIVWTLAKLGVSLIEDWSKWTLKELLLVPYAYRAFGKDPRFRSVANFLGAAQKYHFDLWGDILWSVKTKGSRTATLVPPTSEALRRYKQRLRCYDAPDWPVLDMARILEADWERWFATLPLEAQQLLNTALEQFDSLGDFGDPHSHARPFGWNLDTLDFAWHLTLIAGLTLEEFTVEGALAALASKTPIRPDWDVEASDAAWKHLWSYSARDKLLLDNDDNDAHWRVMLFNHNRARVAKHYDSDERMLEPTDVETQDDLNRRWRRLPEEVHPPSAEENNLAASGGEGGRGGDVGGSSTPDSEAETRRRGDDGELIAIEYGGDAEIADGPGEQPPGEIDDVPLVEQVDFFRQPLERRTSPRGLCLAATGCNSSDSSLHGFLSCSEVRARVWTPCLPLLQAWLGGQPLPSMGDTDVLLSWPRYRGTSARKWRLALWRALIIDHLTKMREAALDESAKLGRRQTIQWSGSTEAAVVYGTLKNLILAKWEALRGSAPQDGLTALQKEYLKRFVEQTSLFRFDGASVHVGLEPEGAS